jgi:hypothetical protein
MTEDDYLQWALSNKSAEPTIQSVISMIRLAPDDTRGKDWLMLELMPILYQRHLSTALCRIAQQPTIAYGIWVRPPLVRLVFDMVCTIITQGEHRQLAAGADSGN